MRRVTLLLAVAVLAAALAPAATLAQSPEDPTQTLRASKPVSTTALAVARTDQGLTGVSARVHATVVANGSGQVFVSTKPLAQTDMQGSARLAARVAGDALGLDWRDHDYFLVFESDSVVIGGPSAGAVMTLATMVALHNVARPDDPWSVHERVAMTGTINPDGTIGPVGGIPSKADAAARAGIDLMLFPAGQERAVRVDEAGDRTSVHVPTYCREQLEITCRSVATVTRAIEDAAGIRLNRTTPEDPTTADYEAVLGPRVRPEVDQLDRRIDDASRELNRTDLTSDERRAVRDSLAAARERLRRAEDALADGRFYTTATMAFQGSIWVGHAENLTELYRADNPAQVVQAAIGTCQAATARARDLAFPLEATGAHELLAIGGAQRRVAQAQELLESARETYRSGSTLTAWGDALFDASFCTERSGTVHFWAGLRDAFGPGPPVAARDLAREVLTLARERVAYARAVLGGQGQDQIQQAADLLSTAGTALRDGRPSQAVIMGVEAQVEASIAVQTAGGGDVPAAVLQAARTAASEAVAEARARDVEPIASVALLELAGDIDGNRTKLSFLWQSRSLAGLTPNPEPRPTSYTFVGPPRALQRTPLAREALLVGVATGLLAGVLLTGVGVLLSRGRTR